MEEIEAPRCSGCERAVDAEDRWTCNAPREIAPGEWLCATCQEAADAARR